MRVTVPFGAPQQRIKNVVFMLVEVTSDENPPGPLYFREQIFIGSKLANAPFLKGKMNFPLFVTPSG